MEPGAQSNTSLQIRSMSYAPESIRPKSVAAVKPAWILCRSLEERPIATDEELLRLANQGRVRPDDYLVSSRLDRCCQARDLAQLAMVFRTESAARLGTAGRILAASALAVLWIAPLLGGFLLLSAIAVTLASLERRDYGVRPPLRSRG